MTQSEIVRKIMKKYHLEYSQANEMVRLVFSEMFSALVKGERVKINGFGSIFTKMNKGHKGYDMVRKVHVQTPPHKRFIFKPTRKLREEVNS